MKFKRATHIDGVFRKDKEEVWKFVTENLVRGVGAHALDSDKPLTLDEIVDEYQKYADEYNEYGDRKEDFFPVTVNTEDVLQDLVWLIKCGAVEIIFDTDLTTAVDKV